MNDTEREKARDEHAQNVGTWGIRPPDPTRPFWGARAIFDSSGRVDIVADRVAFGGPEGADREKLRAFLKKKGTEVIKLLGLALNPGERKELRETVDGYVIAADPKASHGYLYIGVWPA